MMSDLERDQVPAVLAYALQPDEPIRAVVGSAQADPASWGRVPRTYVRTMKDEVVPLSVQHRMIREADRATPGNPFTVFAIDASHFVPLSRPGELADILIA